MALALEKHCCELKVIWQVHKNTDYKSLARPFVTDEEDHTGTVTYPGSQNINGGKAGLRGLGTCQVFPRASMYNWASYALCSLEAICRSPGFPFLLVKSFDHMPKWPGFCLCVREEVISRTWLAPVLWEAFSELQIGLYIPRFWFSVALWVVNSITERTSDSLRAGSSLIYFVSMVSVQFSSVTQSCLTLCNPMNRSTPGLPVHHQLPESTQTHAHWVGASQPSHPLLSPSPPAANPSQQQGLFQWVKSSHEVDKVLEFQLQHQDFAIVLSKYQVLSRSSFSCSPLFSSVSTIWGLIFAYCWPIS